MSLFELNGNSFLIIFSPADELFKYQNAPGSDRGFDPGRSTKQTTHVYDKTLICLLYLPILIQRRKRCNILGFCFKLTVNY